MSRWFPHAAYAEDQVYARTILISHVVHRAAQTGAVITSTYSLARSLIKTRSLTPLEALAKTTGRGAVVGALALGVGGVTTRMWGREEIEWKDRSWRLLENKFQVECDDWSIGGTVLGAGAALARESGRQALSGGGRALRIVGGAGLGNLAGVLGYMAWRHGVKGSKYEE